MQAHPDEPVFHVCRWEAYVEANSWVRPIVDPIYVVRRLGPWS